MPYEEMLAQQFIAFHAAIVDSCGRSSQPRQTDAMALRLRNNALAMTKLQMTLLPLAGGADTRTPGNPKSPSRARRAPKSEPMPEPGHALASEPAFWAEPDPWSIPQATPEPADPESAANGVELTQDYLLSGDALSRFVPRRIDPAESAYQAWHHSLRETASGLRRDATQLYGA